MTPYIGEIRPFAFNFPPRGWAQCNGQLLPINQNQALFSILGTTYGGNGTTTFALPDLRSRAPLHAGAGVTLGQVGGAESVTLTASTMPTHGHAVMAAADLANSTSPSGNVMAAKPRGGANVYAGATNLTTLAPATGGAAGGGQPHSNQQPSLCLNVCIALQGVFPSRS